MPIHPGVYRIPISKARANLGEIVRRVRDDKDWFVIEKDGVPVAGVIDMDELEDFLELRDPELRQQIAEGFEEYRQGTLTTLDSFLTDGLDAV